MEPCGDLLVVPPRLRTPSKQTPGLDLRIWVSPQALTARGICLGELVVIRHGSAQMVAEDSDGQESCSVAAGIGTAWPERGLLPHELALPEALALSVGAAVGEAVRLSRLSTAIAAGQLRLHLASSCSVSPVSQTLLGEKALQSKSWRAQLAGLLQNGYFAPGATVPATVYGRRQLFRLSAFETATQTSAALVSPSARTDSLTAAAKFVQGTGRAGGQRQRSTDDGKTPVATFAGVDFGGDAVSLDVYAVTGATELHLCLAPPALSSYSPRAAEAAVQQVTAMQDCDVAVTTAVGGLAKELNAIRELMHYALDEPEQMQACGLKPPTGALLYGPPGTGKTLLARKLSEENRGRVAFVQINGAEVISQYYGESEERLRQIFASATAVPQRKALVFIDEIDALCPARKGSFGGAATGQSEVSKRLVATLLTILDGAENASGGKTRGRLFLLGATNRPDALDEALRRPGRLDRELELPIPDAAARRQILDAILAPVSHTLTPAQLEMLATRTHGFVGADLAALCKEAALAAIRRQLRGKGLNRSKLGVPTERRCPLGTDIDEQQSTGALGAKRWDIHPPLDLGWAEPTTNLDAAAPVSILARDSYKRRAIWEEQVRRLQRFYASQEIHKGRKEVEAILSKRVKSNVPYSPMDTDDFDALATKLIEKHGGVFPAPGTASQQQLTTGSSGCEADSEVVTAESPCIESNPTLALEPECLPMSLLPVEVTVPEHSTPSEQEPEVSKEIVLNWADFDASTARVAPSALREVSLDIEKVHWTDIGGGHDMKQQLLEAVDWPLRYPEAFVRLGVRPPRGILLYGPPGCSKTLTARAVATESGLNFIAVKGPELFSKWVGDSEKAVREVYRKARQAAPSVVFFDEIDALATTRGAGGGSGVADRVLTQLLTELDGFSPLGSAGYASEAPMVVTVAATNRPDMLDPALLRPGRFDRHIYVGPPDDSARREIIRINLRTVPLQVPLSATSDGNAENLVEWLAVATAGYSGAEVAAVCREACLSALGDAIDRAECFHSGTPKIASTDQLQAENALVVCRRHFEGAVARVKPAITAADLDFYSSWAANAV